MRELFGTVVAITLLLLPASALSKSSVLQPDQPLASSTDTSSPVDKWKTMIAKASAQFNVPAAWIRAVMRIESGGQTVQNGIPITSSAGAMGLMQVMPDTFADMQIRYGLGDDPYDPKNNIAAGAAFLHEMYLRYGYPGLFAAYNAGPARLDQYLYDRTPLPTETLAYLEALGQVQFNTPYPNNFAAVNGRNMTESVAGNFDNSTSNLAFQTPGMAGFLPSSQGLFVDLQKEIPDQH